MKKIKIQNVRLGFATNSSSSHSILVIPKGEIDQVSDNYQEDFGWDYFTLKSKEAKTKYLIATLCNNLQSMSYGESEIKNTIGKLFNVAIDEIDLNSNVDHQSVLTFPTKKNGEINEDFLKDLTNYIINNESVVICGGNDNDDRQHDLKSIGATDQVDNIPKERSPQTLNATKVGDHWVLFNRETGAKMRFSFDLEPKPLTKLPVPELVDIKITDYCPYNCNFCYQDSTEKGQHANLEWIKTLAKEFGEAGVLEVALGGGEPTLHPNFAEILDLFKTNDVVPNFTTKNMTWVKNNPNILNKCGGVAISVENSKDIKKTLAILNEHLPEKFMERVNRNYNSQEIRIQFQYVMGSQPLAELDAMLNTLQGSSLDIPLTLLGFKENGRGEDFQKHDYKQWLDIVQKYPEILKHGNLKIDTALAAQSLDELKKLNVPDNSYHTTEGTFSLYVDAVAKTMAPSSYLGLEQTVPMNLENWKTDYEAIGVDIVDEINKIKFSNKTKKIIKIHPQN